VLPGDDGAGLPPTKLGCFLEMRVNDYLKKQSHPEAGEVAIRVVHVSDKVVEVKPGMKSRYGIAPHRPRGWGGGGGLTRYWYFLTIIPHRQSGLVILAAVAQLSGCLATGRLFVRFV